MTGNNKKDIKLSSMAADQRRQAREQREQQAAARISTDKRFASALTDPRFSRGMSKAQRTVAIDDRFAGVQAHASISEQAGNQQSVAKFKVSFDGVNS
jgi:hypothetical protein